MTSDDLAEYFNGNKLFGDDLSPDEIRAWYDDEKEAYADLGAGDHDRYRYVYHALNRVHGFRWIPAHRFDTVLGFGSAYGDEFLPIADRIGHITILESASAYQRSSVHGAPIEYVESVSSGVLPFNDARFDLITCLGVLHHLPNVSFVVGQIYRCLRPGGYALIREPVVSMGDWRQRRPGLTKRERGIPIHVFDRIVASVGFKVTRRSLCVFPLLPRLSRVIGNDQPYNSRSLVTLDQLLSVAFSWNLRYHARTVSQKLRPSSVYFVLVK